MGEVFAGRYELVEPIGEGATGSVWTVHDRRRDELVAAKVLRQVDSASLMRFLHEQAVRVHHDHVITPIGWAGEDDRVLFTMPLIDGGSLGTLVGDHGALGPRLAAELLRQTCDGLAAIHAAGVIHRDIKPENILLRATGTDRPHAFISDFGIAVATDGPRLTTTGLVPGTPRYMAPEQSGGAEPAPPLDVYAAGRVGQFMLTGLPPEVGVPAQDAVRALAPGTPPELLDVLVAMTAEDPAARPSAQAAQDRLRSLPSLAWAPDAMGEVEVLRQISDRLHSANPDISFSHTPVVSMPTMPRLDAAGPGDARAGSGPVDPTRVAPEAHQALAPEAGQPPAQRGGTPPALAWGGAALLALLGILLIFLAF